MSLHGRWLVKPKDKPLIILPNTVVDEGEAAFLKMALRDDQTFVAGDGNFYAGLMGDFVGEALDLTTITGEPGVVNGYARQIITRNSTGWPTEGTVNSATFLRSLNVTFTPSGGNFDTSISRLFLCNVASGSAGVLFSISAALSAPLLITLGNPYVAQYELYLK